MPPFGGSMPPSSQPHDPTFFVDRCLGRHLVPGALRALGWRIEGHADHFEHNCPDPTWIRDVTGRGWIILTKDKKIRHRRLHLRDLMEARSIAFILTTGNTTAAENVAAFRAAHAGILAMIASERPPLIVTVTQRGSLTSIDLTRMLP